MKAAWNIWNAYRSLKHLNEADVSFFYFENEFRVFENHKYSRIDPREEQEELTTLVKASDNEPFVLHPGEFVLGSTYEKISKG